MCFILNKTKVALAGYCMMLIYVCGVICVNSINDVCGLIRITCKQILDTHHINVFE